MKNYKTQIIIAISAGIAIIIVILAIMLKFVGSNNNSNTVSKNDETSDQVEDSNTEIDENDESENSEEENNNEEENSNDDIKSIALQKRDNGVYLVEIFDDVTVEPIFDTTADDKENYTFQGFDYSDGLIYYLYTDANSEYIYSYDLNSKEENLLAEANNNYDNSFSFYNGNIYYVANNNSIYRFNLDSSNGEEIINSNENEIIVNLQIDKNNNNLYYLKNISDENGNNSGCVYKANLDSLEQEMLINGGNRATEIIFHNGYLALDLITYGTEKDETGKNDIDVTYSQIFIYNTENNSVWQIGSKRTQDENEKAQGHIAFSEKYIVYSDDENVKITDYDGNTINDSLYNALDAGEARSIMDIMMLTSNDLQIRLDETSGNGLLRVSKIINFNEATIKSVSKNYYDIINIE